MALLWVVLSKGHPDTQLTQRWISILFNVFCPGYILAVVSKMYQLFIVSCCGLHN